MKKRRLVCVAVVALLCVLLCGCMSEQDTMQMEMECCAMLDALIANDYDAGRAVLTDAAASDAALKEFFEIASPQLQGIRDYTLKQTGWETSITNGVRINKIVFLMSVEGQPFCYVTAKKIVGETGLDSFYLSGASQNTGSDNDTVTTLIAIVVIVTAVLGILSVPIGVIVFVVYRKKETERIHAMMQAQTSFTVSEEPEAPTDKSEE